MPQPRKLYRPNGNRQTNLYELIERDNAAVKRKTNRAKRLKKISNLRDFVEFLALLLVLPIVALFYLVAIIMKSIYAKTAQKAKSAWGITPDRF